MGNLWNRAAWVVWPLMIACLVSCQAGKNQLIYPQNTVTETRISQPIGVASTAKVGQPVDIALMGGGGSTCFQADRVDVTVDEAAKLVTLKAYVKEVLYPNQGCGAMVIDIPLSASFTPTSTGVYRIEARGWDNAESREIVRVAEVTVTE